MNEEEATQVLLEGQRKKQEAFQKEYEKLCEKHGCRLVGVPGFTEDGRVGVVLQVRNVSTQS